MGILCPESESAKRNIVIRELVQGQESATQLKFLLQKPLGVDGSLSADELLAKILRSFTGTLSILTSSEAADEVGKNQAISGENGSPMVASCNDRSSEDSSESRKKSSPAIKDRRGCYKRRKTAQTWTKISNTTDDNHAWRKYGQKEIQNSKFPRSYFRCTRKYDQGCRATKQVQRVQENPVMYHTTYIGFHTCKDILKAPQVVTDSGNWESIIVNRPETKLPNDEQVVHPLSLSTPTVKQEHHNEDTPSDITDNIDHSLWSDLKDFELSEAAIMPSKMASENADTVYSCTGGSMDFGVDPVHFCADFHFDQLI